MNICFIVSGYPSYDFPAANAFVETLVNAIIDCGEVCYVIAPQSVSNALKHHRKILPYRRERKTPEGKNVTVITPKYFSASTKKIGKLNLADLTIINFRHAAEKALKRLKKEKEVIFDAIYGHFIFPSGIVANYLGHKYNIPSFFAYGENTTYTIDYLGNDKTRRLLQGVLGVISVSSENKRVLLTHGIAQEKNICVFPNSVNTSIFYPHDKLQMRKKFGFPKNAFIIAFTGRLLPVKGPDRLASAIQEIHDKNIFSFFLGEGPLKPHCDNILFCGMVQHDRIAEYLSAADIFVLPTLAEGCCNAIIEAMACGLPIISSALPFNDDILTPDNSIRVNPMDLDGIKKAIIQLRDNKPLRQAMSYAALCTAQQFDINNRAKKILSFMNNQITESRRE